jgi:hypothetical protein
MNNPAAATAMAAPESALTVDLLLRSMMVSSDWTMPCDVGPWRPTR